uniref:Lithium-sensitive myo-inositol monophosphatase A1 n=1 Tax=Bos indicus x Bos taurus TaxID=30522 RepID=A0A4W2GLE3_BOBOX
SSPSGRDMADSWHECIGYAVTLASQAGEVVHEALRNETNAMIKSSPVDLVTRLTQTYTDHKVEKMLTSSIKEKYLWLSNLWQLGKKGVLTDNPTWIIDPTDGTTNFELINSVLESCLS